MILPHEQAKIDKGDVKGCAVCKSKETGKWQTQGACGSTDHLYYCEKCGTVRVYL